MPGEMAGALERAIIGDRGDGDRREPRLGDLLERPAHQLGLEQRQPPLEAIGPRPRHLDDPAELGPVVLLDQRDMVDRVEVEPRPLALGADDDIAVLVGPDRRPLPRDPRQPQHHRLERGFLLGQPALELARLRPRRLGLGAKRRALLGAGVLEPRADRIAARAQPLDLGLRPAHLGLERQQRVEVDADPLVADRALDLGAVRLDGFHAQHGASSATEAGAGGNPA